MDKKSPQESAGSSDSNSTGVEQRLKQLFLSCDSNNDGLLDCYDLYEMCSRLRMEDHAEEVISMLGAHEKENISLEEFLSCRKKVFLEAMACGGTRESPGCTYVGEQHFCSLTEKFENPNKFNNGFPCEYTSFGGSSLVHTTSTANGITECDLNPMNKLERPVNGVSPVNSGAKYDSSAHDRSNDSQDLHALLRRNYPQLYDAIFLTTPSTPLDDVINGALETKITSPSAEAQMVTTSTTYSRQRMDESIDSQIPNGSKVTIPDSGRQTMSQPNISPSVELARRLFDCMSLLYSQQTARLRSEVFTLSNRIRGLQMNYESSCRDWQRLERERDQLRHELSNQIARYEDRLTELHSVIAELRRRLENAGTNMIPETDEFEEVEEYDNGQLSLSDPTRPRVPTGHVPRARDHESAVHTDARSDRSSEGNTSVGAVDGDLMDTGAFHTRPNRFANHLDLSSSSSDLVRLRADLIIRNKYDPFHLTGKSALIKPLASGKTTPDTDARLFTESHLNSFTTSTTPVAATTHTAAVTTTTTTTTKIGIGVKPVHMTLLSSMEMANSSPDVPYSSDQAIAEYQTMVQRLRNELERVVRERDRLVQLVRSRYDLVPQVTIHNNPAADITAQSSPVCRPSSVGMGQNMQQSKLGGSMDSSAFERGIPDDRAVRTGSLGSCPTQPRTNNWKPGHESGDECSSNVYDLPEPDWVSLSLSGYNEKIHQLGSSSSDLNQIKPNKTQQSTSSSTGLFPPGARGRGPAMASLNFLCETTTDLETESSLTTPLSSQALITLLHNLAQRVPYPRLAEAMHCAELTWECVLATLARYRSDCVVLQANLAEAKSHADRIQCQLNQIDANWTATMRAAWMADTSLEIMDSLNQLYATELAILLYRQTKKSFLAAQTFSTLSSSTSSSSVPCRGKPAQNRYTTRPTGNGLVACGRPVQSSNPASVTPSSPQHPYAIYAVPGYAGSESESQAVPTTNVPSQFNLSLRTLRSIRYQAELSAQALLERYEQMDINTQDRFYPTVSSTSAGVGGCVNGNGGVVSASLTRGLTRAQNPAPVSPGLLSIHSPLGPPVPSTQSLTGSSLYANSWYVSLGRNGRSNGPGLVPEQTSLGSGLGSGYLIHQNKLPNYNLPLVRGSTKSVPQSHPVVSNGVIGSGGAVGNGVVSGGGGWQTPDSGAGSSSTHEVTQPVMFHTVFPSGLIDLNTYETVLDLMPSVPLYFRPGRVEDNAHSFCDSDSDTSESSDGDSRAPLHSTIPVTAAAQGHMGPSSTCGLIRSGHATTMTTAATTNNVASVITNPSTQSNLIPIQTGWSRADERKLRIWLYQLVHSRRILRSTIVENLPNLIEDDGLSDGHQSVTKGSFQCISNGSLGKWSLNVLLESSILLQELCTVKEERADLKARVYLLEKELHANRLTLESRLAAENALRAHLDALRLSLQETASGTPTPTDEQRDSRVGTGQTEALLRAQVKNLLQALESLRHSSELQQTQNEELVDDLKRANSALIAAFEKAKRKYLTRIKKLEDQAGSKCDATRATPHSHVSRPVRDHSETGANPAAGVAHTNAAPDGSRVQLPPPMTDRPLPPVSTTQGQSIRGFPGKSYHQTEDHQPQNYGPSMVSTLGGFSHTQMVNSSAQARISGCIGINNDVTRGHLRPSHALDRIQGAVGRQTSQTNHILHAGAEFPSSPCRTERPVPALPIHRAT